MLLTYCQELKHLLFELLVFSRTQVPPFVPVKWEDITLLIDGGHMTRDGGHMTRGGGHMDKGGGHMTRGSTLTSAILNRFIAIQ